MSQLTGQEADPNIHMSLQQQVGILAKAIHGHIVGAAARLAVVTKMKDMFIMHRQDMEGFQHIHVHTFVTMAVEVDPEL